MLEPGAPFRFSIRRCGATAQRLLRADAPCRVAAVFERSFYLEAFPLEFGGAMACLGGAEIGPGPLNGLLDSPAGMNWPASGLRVGAACRKSAGALYLGKRFVLSLNETHVWRPERVSGRPDPVSVSRSLERLLAASGRRGPAADLAACREPLAAARRWLAHVFAGAQGDPRYDVSLNHLTSGETAWARDLIGLGPGLTPSGDDFIGGIMIALHALGYAEAGRRLAGAAARAAASNSNAISAAHLAAAGEGQGSAAIHAVLNDLLRGECDNNPARLEAVGRIGHGSGWDTLAGIATVLRAWAESRGVRRHAA